MGEKCFQRACGKFLLCFHYRKGLNFIALFDLAIILAFVGYAMYLSHEAKQMVVDFYEEFHFGEMMVDFVTDDERLRNLKMQEDSLRNLGMLDDWYNSVVDYFYETKESIEE